MAYIWNLIDTNEGRKLMIKYISYPQKCLITALNGVIVPIMTYTQAKRYITQLMNKY